MTKVKICGLSRREDIDAVNRALPDYIGFVFAPSRRRVDAETAAALKERLDGRIKTVGVFAGQDIETVAELCRNGVIDWIQLHGGEDGAYIRRLRDRADVPIIKAVPVTTAAIWPDGADYALFDGPRGGGGETFDWTLLQGTDRPYFLAGGLHAGNVRAALKRKPYAVDVSGGVETGGVKDAAKIDAFVRLVRAEELY
ncbi:MAG: phosphoribosylanthranilate isomerase [Oscillospiraceae bacterium]|jgi:phosphoribosylanthranilate isomerase|nr:phosphoribosylanthranilate isomerase [Oscillospiraceae bacterium]